MEARGLLEVVGDARLVLRLQRGVEFFVLTDELPEVVDAKDVGALLKAKAVSLLAMDC